MSSAPPNRDDLLPPRAADGNHDAAVPPTEGASPARAAANSATPRDTVAKTVNLPAAGEPAAVISGEFVIADEVYDTELVWTQAASYRLQGQIAHGAMGVVFKGRDAALGRDIALKVLNQQYQHDGGMRRRFLNEVRITGRLQHPGVVPVYGLGEFGDGRPFFTMRLVEGRTLAELMAERAQPSENLAYFLKIFEQICQVLAYAHAHGIIHRDLKPANVMVGEFGVVKVMDWGLAKVVTEPEVMAATPVADIDGPVEPPAEEKPPLDASDASCRTRVGTIIGSPAYISPEQARGEVDCLDARTDVFGLGAILCEILTGQPAHLGSGCTEVCRKAAGADVTDAFARLAACGADPALITLALRCLAADKENRLNDAGAVAAELMNYLESVLKQPERDLVRFFELSPDLFCIAGFDGFFHRVNGNFSRVLGYSARELESRPFLEFVHPEDEERTRQAMDCLVAGWPVTAFRNRYRAADGTYRWFEWTAKSIPDEKIIFAAARDVTAEENSVLPRLAGTPA